MTDLPAPDDPDLELVILGYLEQLDDEQRAGWYRAAKEGRTTTAWVVGDEGELGLDIGIVQADGTHRLMFLDATAFGYELDEHGDVIHRPNEAE
jgi:hypothetical protein